MTDARQHAPAGPRRSRLRAIRLGLAAAVVAVEVVAVRAASDSFVLSTVEQQRAEAADAHLVLRLCAIPLLGVAAGYATVGRSRLAGGLLAVAAVGTVLGLWTWLATAPLAVIALIAPIVRRGR